MPTDAEPRLLKVGRGSFFKDLFVAVRLPKVGGSLFKGLFVAVRLPKVGGIPF